MSDIGTVTNSLTSSLLGKLLSGSNASASSGTTESAETAADIISLLGGSRSASDTSIYSILSGSQGSGDSSGSLYNILLSAESASLMEASPSFLKNVLSSAQASAASGTSSTSTTSTQDLLEKLQDIKLVTLSADSILSLLKSK